MAFCPTICNEATVEFLQARNEYRLSCSASEDVSYKWWFRSSDEETPYRYVTNPRTNVDTERELIIKGGNLARTNGYYFCVMKSATSNDVAVSQLVSVNTSGIDVTYLYVFVYIQNLGVQYPNMTREDPRVLPLSRPESCATSAEDSDSSSMDSLSWESKAKKASRFFFFIFFFCIVLYLGKERNYSRGTEFYCTDSWLCIHATLHRTALHP